MDNREIAKELAVACLSHETFSVYFRPQGTEKNHAVAAGEKVGEFCNAIWKTLLQETSGSSKGPTAHQV